MAPGLHMLPTNLLVAIHQMMLQLLLLQATTFHSEKRYNVLHTWWFWPFSKVTSTLCPIVGHNGEELGSYPVPYAMILTSAILYPCFPNVHTKSTCIWFIYLIPRKRNSSSNIKLPQTKSKLFTFSRGLMKKSLVFNITHYMISYLQWSYETQIELCYNSVCLWDVSPMFSIL